MSRRSIFKKAEITEIKREMRNGTKIKELANRLAPKYNLTEKEMLNKLYYVSAHTYMIKRKTKQTVKENTTVAEVETMMPVEEMAIVETMTVEAPPAVVNAVPAVVGRKVEMYDDHIRIYF
jgi:prenyltransferase beta subunit